MKLPHLMLAGLVLASPAASLAQGDPVDHQHHHMSLSGTGLVMNANSDRLPRDCAEISRDYQFTVHAGRKYAASEPGVIFGMSQHELRVDPCSRVEITFVNDDEIRHQWMLHGLPKYLYPAGMFHIEVAGGQQATGTLIVPGGDQTYLVHCDLAQHMEKGMRGQLVVGKGSGNLWSVPEISDHYYRSAYLPANIAFLAGIPVFLGILLVAVIMKVKYSGGEGK